MCRFYFVVCSFRNILFAQHKNYQFIAPNSGEIRTDMCWKQKFLFRIPIPRYNVDTVDI